MGASMAIWHPYGPTLVPPDLLFGPMLGPTSLLTMSVFDRHRCSIHELIPNGLLIMVLFFRACLLLLHSCRCFPADLRTYPLAKSSCDKTKSMKRPHVHIQPFPSHLDLRYLTQTLRTPSFDLTPPIQSFVLDHEGLRHSNASIILFIL